jgi:aminoglycoside phosphotransferase (APT) family kinase protein
MPEAFRGIEERLATNIIPLMGELSRRPWTMMHGDFRLDNLLFPPLPDGEAIAVIDWQITSRGRGAFDLGYFFCTSMEADVRRKHERDLMDLYFATLVDGGVTDYSREELLRDYRIATLFSLVYTVITLGSLDMGNERGLALFKALLSRNIAAIADYDAGSLM